MAEARRPRRPLPSVAPDPRPRHDEDGWVTHEVVRSGRSAVPASLPVRFCGPPPEPDVPVAGHPALHRPRKGRVGQAALAHGLGIAAPR